MAKRETRFGNELDDPMPSFASELRAAMASDDREAAFDALEAQWEAEESRKLALLSTHYRIDPETANPWRELACALARDYVPAFREKPTPGPDAKWNSMTGGMLVAEVEALVADADDKAKGISWAAETIAKREPWKSFLRSNDESLADPGGSI